MSREYKAIDGTTFLDERPSLQEWLATVGNPELIRLEYNGEGDPLAYVRRAGVTEKITMPADVTMTRMEFGLYTGGVVKKTYWADREKSRTVVWVKEKKGGTEMDAELDTAPSLAVENHSPAGFEWGYSGSGPAQLALAILLDLFGDKEKALALYQDFKFSIVGNLKIEKWELPEEDIRQWITNREAGKLL